MTWVLVAPWPKPPLSMNDRGGWQAHAETIRGIRDWACVAAKAAKIGPQAHITVRLVWTVPTLARRDEENPVATLKPICDGLAAPLVVRTKNGIRVSAGALIVPDDTPEFMTKLMPVIEYAPGKRGVRVEIEAR